MGMEDRVWASVTGAASSRRTKVRIESNGILARANSSPAEALDFAHKLAKRRTSLLGQAQIEYSGELPLIPCLSISSSRHVSREPLLGALQVFGIRRQNEAHPESYSCRRRSGQPEKLAGARAHRNRDTLIFF